jgi:hypothetical protein
MFQSLGYPNYLADAAYAAWMDAIAAADDAREAFEASLDAIPGFNPTWGEGLTFSPDLLDVSRGEDEGPEYIYARTAIAHGCGRNYLKAAMNFPGSYTADEVLFGFCTADFSPLADALNSEYAWVVKSGGDVVHNGEVVGNLASGEPVLGGHLLYDALAGKIFPGMIDFDGADYESGEGAKFTVAPGTVLYGLYGLKAGASVALHQSDTLGSYGAWG